MKILFWRVRSATVTAHGEALARGKHSTLSAADQHDQRHN